MFDLETITDLSKKRGLPLSEVLASGGGHPGHVRRVLSQHPDNLDYGTVLAICDKLGIPVADVDPRVLGPRRENARWVRFRLKDFDLISRYHYELERSRHCVTITRGIESYLQTPEMTEWTSRFWLGNPGWNQRIDMTKAYRVQIVGARERSKFIHRIVAPGSLFVTAAQIEPGWVENVKETLETYEQTSLLGLVWDWERFCSRIESIVPRWVRRWEKVSIVDGIVALVRGSVERYALTYDPATVSELLTCTEQAACDEVPSFALSSRIKARRNKRAITQMYNAGIASLDLILRGKHRAQRP